MTCPRCSLPMLFGAATCACGYSQSTSQTEESDGSIELSYFEALRAFWRVYWPMQLLVGLGIAFLGGGLFGVLLQFVLVAAALFLFLGRIAGRPYRGFSIVVLQATGQEVSRHLTMRQRLDVWAFLWWRQMLAGMLAGFLTGPLNALLGIMGVNGAEWVAVAGGVLVIGPILIKMLIGHPFATFFLAARRSGEINSATQSISPGPRGECESSTPSLRD